MSIHARTLRDNTLALIVTAIIGLAIFLFGADTSSASLAISVLIFAVTAIAVWRIPELYPGPLVLCMIVLWGAVTVIHMAQGHVTGQADHYLMLLTAIAVFWLGQSSAKLGDKPNRLWTILLLLGLGFSGFAFFQHIVGPDHILGMERPYHHGRLGGTFLSANTAASLLGMIMICAFGHVCRSWFKASSRSQKGRSDVLIDFVQRSVLGLLTFLFSLSALMMTASRAGIAISLCALFVFALWIFIQRMKTRGGKTRLAFTPSVLWGVGLLVVIATFWNLSGDMANQRYGTLIDDYQSRKDILTASWTAIQYEPLIGHGFGHFNEAKLLGTDPLTNETVMIQNAAHNFYVQTVVQSGVLGLFAIFWIYLLIMASLLRGISRGQPYRTYLIAVALMSFIIASHGLFDYALEIPAVMLFHAWVIGIGYGLSEKYKAS